MGKRITLLFDDDLEKKLRLRHGKLIQQTGESVSFSKVVNDLLKQGLKKR